MRHNDVSLRQIFQRRLIGFVQLVELFFPFLIICLIVCAMLRIRLRKRFADILHFLFCVHRVQPDVGVILTVLVGVMTVRCGDNSVVGGIVFMRGRIAHSGVFFIRMIMTVLISMRGPMVMAVLFVLIGMLTAVWRSAGTIPYIIHHCLPWVDPAHFHLWVFLLCSLLSLLLGTSFGTSSTLGVVFMLLARTAGLDPLLTAGAVMSGIYVGDRSSPMSSSAALVCALTGTSIYDNVRLMWRTSLLPFFRGCLAYVLLPSARAESLPHVDGLFADGLVLDARALLPAVFMLVPLLLRWDVKKIMACSILAGCVVSLAVQQMAPAALLRCLVLGYEPPAGMEMLAGGGLLSMAQVAGIVLLTSAYAGLLEATGLLDGLSSLCKRLSLRLGAFRTTVLAGLPVAAVSCNQTLGIMLTKQLCAPLWQNGKEMVLPLENGIVLLAAIIPWSIAGSVPCAIMGVGPECLPYAFYLYMVPLTDMLLRRR